MVTGKRSPAEAAGQAMGKFRVWKEVK